MSRPFCSTYSARFNSISRHSSGSEYINAKIKMPFCPRVWHLARQGSTLAAQCEEGSPEAACTAHGWPLWLPQGLFREAETQTSQRSSSAGFVSWKFLWKKLVSEGKGGGGVECYFIYGKQITLSLILQTFFAEEKNPCFILRFLVWFILRFRKHKRVRPSRQMHLPWRNAFAIALQQWPREYLQFTLDFFFLFFFFYCLENGPGSWA